jgi:IclR family acetate operon transcriptional repressor
VAKLKQDLAVVRQEGIATDDEEREIGVKCIASPIKNDIGSIIAALSVSGPSARLSSKRIREMKPLIRSCALEISRAMGYQAEE